MHPRQLRTFIAVAQSGNITRAAAEVHLAQSSVSDQIQALEADVGGALFIRSRSGLALTAAGEALLPYAKEMVSIDRDARLAVGECLANARQVLAIGTLETIASMRLAALLSGFNAVHPHIVVRLEVGSSGALMAQLQDGTIDLAVLFDGHDHRDMRVRKLADEPMVLIGPSGNAPAIGRRLEDLAGEGFVATARGCIYRHLFDNSFIAAGLGPPKPVIEANSINTIAGMVAARAGLALVPRLAVADDLTTGRIIELPWPGDTLSAPLNMVWRRGKARRPAVSAFVDFAFSSPVKSGDDHPRHETSSPL